MAAVAGEARWVKDWRTAKATGTLDEPIWADKVSASPSDKRWRGEPSPKLARKGFSAFRKAVQIRY
jgi:hypothetical protein